MRLRSVFTLQLQEFSDDNSPAYAILSHTWEKEEVTYQDLKSEAYASKKGFIKIRACCSQAFNDGYDWVWVDTCCIDKTSSAELSEAINSMFHWYSDAVICYVFLSDLPAQDPCDLNPQSFLNCKWFTRGWTLQELLAPVAVEFYDQGWNEVGTKLSLGNLIHVKTGIGCNILSGRLSLFSASIAERMSWASSRKTSREEDIAYSLLEIFDINMPLLLYGEGERAFSRLQQEILRKSEDMSILLWRSTSADVAVFAQAPVAFRNLRFQTGRGQPVVALERTWEIIKPLVIANPSLTLPGRSAGGNAATKSIHSPTITSRGLGARLPFISKQRLTVHRQVVDEKFYACARCEGDIAAGSESIHLDGYLCILLRESGSFPEITSTHMRSRPDSIFFKSKDESFEYSPHMYMCLENLKNTWIPRVFNQGFRVVLDQRSPYALRICQLNSSIRELLDPCRQADMLRYHIKTRDSGLFHIQLISKPWLTQTEGPEVYQALVGIRSDFHDELSCRNTTDQNTLDSFLLRNNVFRPRSLSATWHQRNEWSDRSYVVLPDRRHVLAAAIKKSSTYPVLLYQSIRELEGLTLTLKMCNIPTGLDSGADSAGTEYIMLCIPGTLGFVVKTFVRDITGGMVLEMDGRTMACRPETDQPQMMGFAERNTVVQAEP
ncbi:HET domain-containing protein [Colletotrichum salicis]|uniref:HET domain-containing protein n=1 Tax=Colletotrichum salicis TaxID=1209931 RepID=A0A135V8L0_9PEZI|nr:HET domain-containing protein [Colletotrichum salicis]